MAFDKCRTGTISTSFDWLGELRIITIPYCVFSPGKFRGKYFCIAFYTGTVDVGKYTKLNSVSDFEHLPRMRNACSSWRFWREKKDQRLRHSVAFNFGDGQSKFRTTIPNPRVTGTHRRKTRHGLIWHSRECRHNGLRIEYPV